MSASRISVLAITALLASAAMAPAQELWFQYDPNGETTRVDGPFRRHQTHVLKLSQTRYAVLFRPGYVDAATAVRAVTPLCAQAGKRAVGSGEAPPVDLVMARGESSVHLGYRVDCQ